MIIGIMGFMGSGKGTVGDHLQKEGFYKFAFADTLKDVVSTIFLWPRELLEGDTEPSRAFRERKDPWWSERFGYDVTPRLMLQKMGTEVGREVFHKDIWLHCLERRIQSYPNVVVTDVRFPNEVAFIRRLGGKIVRVERGPGPEHERAVREQLNPNTPVNLEPFMKLNFPNVHPSEYAWLLEKPDFTIKNNSTLEDLHAEVQNVLTSLQENATI